MTTTRPGVERIARQALVAQHAALTRDLARHLVTCGACHLADNNLYMRCATWWDMAKANHLAVRKLRQYDTDHNPNQAALPGLE